MPAKNLARVSVIGTYSHIYNRGIEDRFIFIDDQDYSTFIDYLKGYLSAPSDPESRKLEFTVNGKTYRGTPHQPKNYFKRIELVSYSLVSDHFHLILHQLEAGSVERFIRSLCTRYSMYFNKKYNRKGALFNGPYKSIEIKNKETVELLSAYLHHKSGKYTSYADYIGSVHNSWVTPISTSLKGFEPDENQKKAINVVNFEDINSHLERRIPARTQTQHQTAKITEKKNVKTSKKSYRIPEIFASIAVFIALVGLGINNINATNVNSNENQEIVTLTPEEILGTQTEIPAATEIPTATPYPTNLATPTIMPLNTSTPNPVVLQTTSPSTTPTPSPTIISSDKKTLAIKINDGSPFVNIRKSPTTSSEKIGQAKESEVFEYVSVDKTGWYKIILKEGYGYVSAKYIEIQKSN